MTRLTCLVVLAVVGVGATAHAQISRYKVKTRMGTEVGVSIEHGSMRVVKGKNTHRGYMTYRGSRRFGKHRTTAIVLGVRTSKGLRFFAAYDSKRGHWLAVLRKTNHGFVATVMDHKGKVVEGTVSGGANRAFSGKLRARGKSWRASVVIGVNARTTWRWRGHVYKGYGCKAGNTYAFAFGHKYTELVCYTLDGKNLRGEQATNSEVSETKEWLTRLP